MAKQLSLIVASKHICVSVSVYDKWVQDTVAHLNSVGSPTAVLSGWL